MRLQKKQNSSDNTLRRGAKNRRNPPVSAKNKAAGKNRAGKAKSF
jgi:hypothetical protein